MENLRYMLWGHDPSEPVYYGCQFKPYVKQGWSAGYVLSRDALMRFVEVLNIHLYFMLVLYFSSTGYFLIKMYYLSSTVHILIIITVYKKNTLIYKISVTMQHELYIFKLAYYKGN